MAKKIIKKADPRTSLYTIFHLNLAYSSIAEKDIPKVIRSCYWPLLRLAEKFPKAVSIEASGYTLEKIQKTDPSWIKKLKQLSTNGVCEFIGAGYAQVIGPLVPAEVNEKNLVFGNEVYRELLGFVPAIVYVNEQAYGPGLLAHYIKSGYRAIIMEWNNPAYFHPDWPSEMSYYPQIVLDQHDRQLSVVWNNSTHFQRFQRYVHDEIDAEQYFSYVASHASAGRYLCLYGSDSEIFDFRPGRFHTEAELKKGEFKKIETLFGRLKKDRSYSFVLPSDVLSCVPGAWAFKKIHLESVIEPLPVKKQEKYNITRWGVTGRRTMDRNTDCYKIYDILKNDPTASAERWKELCFFWSSDFRTHIEAEREKLFVSRLSKSLSDQTGRPKRPAGETNGKIARSMSFVHKGLSVKRHADRVVISSNLIELVLNCKRGMAIESLIFKNVSPIPLITTVQQGYYEDNDFNADFFSGHATLDVPGFKKITDLNPIEPVLKIFSVDGRESVSAVCVIPFGDGVVNKKITVDSGEAKVRVEYGFPANIPPKCSFRAGFLTYNPEAFDVKSLFYACHNGGYDRDVFCFGSEALKVSPVSLLVSARRALGNTTGLFEIGDAQKTVCVETEMQNYAALPMVQYEKMLRTQAYFLRSKFSLQEFDDTTVRDNEASKKPFTFALIITAKKNN